jgi:hypothetical protein
MSSDDGQDWPKHAKAKLVLTPIKLVTLDALLLLIHIPSVDYRKFSLSSRGKMW